MCKMKKNRIVFWPAGLLVLLVFLMVSCKQGKKGAAEAERSYVYQSNWQDNPERGLPTDKWHLLTAADWKINGNRLECTYMNEADPTQMAIFLDSLFGVVSREFGIEALMGPVEQHPSVSKFSEGGFLITGDPLSHPINKGFFAGLDGQGKLFIKNYQTDRYFQHSLAGEPVPVHTRLELQARLDGPAYSMFLYQWDPDTGELKDSLSMKSISPDLIRGRVALVSRSGHGDFATPWWFKEVRFFELKPIP